jgi:hypothetical protein
VATLTTSCSLPSHVFDGSGFVRDTHGLAVLLFPCLATTKRFSFSPDQTHASAQYFADVCEVFHEPLTLAPGLVAVPAIHGSYISVSSLALSGPLPRQIPPAPAPAPSSMAVSTVGSPVMSYDGQWCQHHVRPLRRLSTGAVSSSNQESWTGLRTNPS